MYINNNNDSYDNNSTNNFYLFDIEYNTNSDNKNHNRTHKFRQNPRRQVFCLSAI